MKRSFLFDGCVVKYKQITHRASGISYGRGEGYGVESWSDNLGGVWRVECFVVPAYRVKAVDTVAAGDSFNGALAVALTEGKTMKEAVQFANAMAGLTVQVAGAIPSLHTRAQVEEFIRTYPNT